MSLKEAASVATVTRPAISAVSATVLAANTKRVMALLSNNTGSTVYLQYGSTAVTSQGIPLVTATTHVIGLDKPWIGSVTCVAGGAGNLDVLEILERT